MSGGWQPIETAPKDSNAIILGWYPAAFQGRGCGACFVWSPHENAFVTWPGIFKHMEPTHWMPLPEPPVSA